MSCYGNPFRLISVEEDSSSNKCTVYGITQAGGPTSFVCSVPVTVVVRFANSVEKAELAQVCLRMQILPRENCCLLPAFQSVAPDGRFYLCTLPSVAYLKRHVLGRIECYDVAHGRFPRVVQSLMREGYDPNAWYELDPINNSSLPRPVRPQPSSKSALRIPTCSFDIECAVGPDTGFPDPEAARVPVLCVCFYLELGGGQPPQRIAYSLMPSDQPRCEDGSDIDVRHYPGGEVQMLGAVWHFMTCCLPRPCIVTGWNSTGFDAWYLWNRCKRLGVSCRTARCWRSPNGAVSFSMPGAIVVDALALYRVSYNEVSYKLDAVAKKVLGDSFGKLDMPYDELLPRSQTTGGQRTILEYCCVDAELPVLIMSAKALIEQSHALAVASCCLLSDVLNRGTQVRTLTLLSRECMRRKPQYHIPYVTDSNRPNAGGSQYQGGHVLQPTPGVHRNLAVYDFMSLYPTVLLAHQVDYSTLYHGRNLVGVDCEHVLPCAEAVIPFMDDRSRRAWACAVRPSSSTHTSILPGVFFRRRLTGSFAGFVPTIVENLLKSRRETKKRLKTLERGTVEYGIADVLQKAYKVGANSVYGFLGAAARGLAPMPCAASSICAWGRHYLMAAKSMVESRGAVCAYGDTDSIFVQSSASPREVLSWCAPLFPPPMLLEHEADIDAMLILTKKRYAYRERGGDFTIKGLESLRRDYPRCVSHTQREVLKSVLEDQQNGLRRAIDLVAGEFKRCRDMATAEFPYQHTADSVRPYVITKELTKSHYALPHPVHVAAAHRSKQTFGLRDRVPYVIAHVPTDPCGAVADRSMCTVDFLSSSHPRELDYTWYCEQMRRSLETVLKLAGASDADVRAAMKMPDTVVRAESDKSAIDAFCSGRRGRIVHRKRHRDANPAPQGMGAKKQMLIATFFT